MTSWDPGEYMRFGDERTRPSVDLASRIAVESPVARHRPGVRTGQQHARAAGSAGRRRASSAWTAPRR